LIDPFLELSRHMSLNAGPPVLVRLNNGSCPPLDERKSLRGLDFLFLERDISIEATLSLIYFEENL